MQILFINNHGAGFADHIEVPDATTITALFDQRMPDAEAKGHLIRVNRQPVASNYVLQEGDRVSITPLKIEGAAA